jgi:hypothetical protein
MSENIFDSFEEVNKFTYYAELKKVRSRLLTIALLLFLSDLLGMLVSDLLTVQLLLWSLIIPAIIASLAFLAFKEPLAAMIIATVIIAALWIYIVAMTGARGPIAGFLVKAIVIYLLATGISSAKNAQRLKKELGNLV